MKLLKLRAFTLVELLVVISIIALLLAILMPALNKVREMGRRAVCGTNQKQISLAFLMYATEYGGAIVPDRRYYLGMDVAADTIARPWDSFLCDQWQTKKNDTLKKFLICPSDKKKRILDPRKNIDLTTTL